MANYKITIGGADVSAFVSASSVSLQTAKNSSPSTFDFDFAFQGTKPTFTVLGEAVDLPFSGQTVEFFEDDVKRFGGKIMQVRKTQEGTDFFKYSLPCQDYSRILQMGEPIAEIYRDMSVNSIIADIVSRYTFYSQINIYNVDCDTVIDYLFLDHKTLWEVLGELSKRTGYEFFVDADKKLYFYLAGSIFGEEISTTNGMVERDSLQINEQAEQVFNFLIIKGGEYDGSELVSREYVADGGTEIEITGKFSGISVSVNGTAQNVGVFGLDTAEMPSVYNCLYDFNGRKVIFDETTKPVSGATVSVSGHQKISVLVQVQDQASISKYGIIPKKITDSSLKTKESAFQFGKAELMKYANDVESGSFKTQSKNFRAGQRIIVDFFGEKKAYDIQSTSTVFLGEEKQITNVKIASAEIIDSVKILIDLLNEKNASSDASQILEVLRTISEKIGVAEIWKFNENIYRILEETGIGEEVFFWGNRDFDFGLGDFFPTDLETDNDRVFILDGSLLG